MFRPIITTLLEYVLMIWVLKRGKFHHKIIATILFFLASYQLGEVVVLLTNGSETGFKIAYISTNMLPPLGLLLISKILNRNFGYLLIQIVAIVFAIYILMIPRVALQHDFSSCCIRVNEYDPILEQFWIFYYQGTLTYSILIMLWAIFIQKTSKFLNSIKMLLIAFLSFDGVALLLGIMYPNLWPSVASIMCALAAFAAILLSRMALAENGEFKLSMNIIAKRDTI